MSFLAQFSRDSLVYTLGMIVAKGMAVFLLPIYTRVLAPNEYGVFDLIIVCGAFLNLAFGLEIYQAVARRLAEVSEPVARRIVSSTAFWFVMASNAIFFLSALILAPILAPMVAANVSTPHEIVILGALFIALNGVYVVLLNQFRWELRVKEYTLITLIYAGASVLLAVLFTFGLDLGFVGVMLAQVGAVAIASTLCILRLRSSYAFVFDVSHLTEMLRFSAPLVPASLAVFISIFANRFALTQFSSLEQVGVFAVASRVSMMAALLVSGVQAALTPLVYKYHAQPETARQLSEIFAVFSAGGLFFCVTVTLFSHEIILVFSTAQYMDAAPLIALLVPSVLLSQIYVFAPGIGIAKKTIWQLWISIAAALVSVVANILLVPFFGIWGAAVATFVSSLAFWMLWLRVSQRLYFVPYVWGKTFLGIFAALVVVLSVAYIADFFMDRITLFIFKTVILAVFAVFLFSIGLVPNAFVRKIYRMGQ